ncbi:bifunctional phosphoribosyl-AMP cyclohydrolase/phosphoribosyl-ATP diphosphatase HisIE [Bacteroides propionicifaciens]|uniref:bifunctional phosphoribosyl-AMP cyclohydrolase/phosphoribosyl-ATP diphosphatase HisIE n=1 Tax=Bacteroides propionicifaciens TaxID=392838 RepID=UPI00036B4615
MDKQVKRIIPCIDIKNGKAVKGVNFLGVKEVGDILDLANKYALQGADELVLLDISASHEKRTTNQAWVGDVVRALDIPVTIGGGISLVADAKALLDLGATRVSVGSAALKNPDLIDQLVSAFGSDAVVLAIDAQLVNGEWMVFSDGGRTATNLSLLDWAKESEKRGAGSILFTSIAHDGKQTGYPVEALGQLKDVLTIPIIASGGAGKLADFYDALSSGRADAVLAASLFHYNQVNVDELKFFLWREGVTVDLSRCIDRIQFDEKGLVPAVIQDITTGTNLMLGYMNKESLQKTLDTGLVTFFSRSRQKLWTKGEESGNLLHLFSLHMDCDQDALLVKVKPVGPTCHTGSSSCWNEHTTNHEFLFYLESFLKARRTESADSSYTASLYQRGTAKIAQKVGEEAVELVIEAMRDKDDLFLGEAADLLYHYIVLLEDKGFSLSDVIGVLQSRHKE